MLIHACLGCKYIFINKLIENNEVMGLM
jgi:hypothetical protein